MPFVRFRQTIRHKAARLRAYTRIKHHKGHGVHSPFVYSLIREVFMKREITNPDDTALYKSLRNAGIDKYSAVQLQNLHTFCKYSGFVTGSCGGMEYIESFLYIVIPKPDGKCEWLLNEDGRYNKSTIVVMSPYADMNTLEVCKTLIGRRDCMSIDNRRYMIFFYDKKLPVQHFKL